MLTEVSTNSDLGEPAGELLMPVQAGFREAELLITALRGLPLAVSHEVDWTALLTIAGDNGVLLRLSQSLMKIETPVPDFFAQAVERSTAAALKLAADLRSLLMVFADRGIAILPLKGPMLGVTLYGDAGLRSSNDLDLLVRRKDFSRAEALLLEQGFITLDKPSDHDCKFLCGDLVVELHFELLPLRYLPLAAGRSGAAPALAILRARRRMCSAKKTWQFISVATG